MRKPKLGVLVVLLIIVVIAWYLNRDTLPTTGKTVAGDSSLPCHVYKEHRKEVAVAAGVPVLKDQKAPVYKVLNVIDGDTIVINKNGETRVRLLAMDAPEKSTTRYDTAEYFGEEAWKHAESLIAESGREVRITYDQVKKDKYDRDLAYVWLKDGRMLNALMVADGYAYSYTSSPKPEYVDDMLSLMRRARTQDLGLWGHCQ